MWTERIEIKVDVPLHSQRLGLSRSEAERKLNKKNQDDANIIAIILANRINVEVGFGDIEARTRLASFPSSS